VDVLDRYLLARRQAKFSTAANTPLFINVHHPRHQIDLDREDRRLSRRGIRFIVDSYLGSPALMVISAAYLNDCSKA
jgi:integrase/recombinase XerD